MSADLRKTVQKILTNHWLGISMQMMNKALPFLCVFLLGCGVGMGGSVVCMFKILKEYDRVVQSSLEENKENRR